MCADPFSLWYSQPLWRWFSLRGPSWRQIKSIWVTPFFPIFPLSWLVCLHSSPFSDENYLIFSSHNSYGFRNWDLFCFYKPLSYLSCGLLRFLWASFLLVLQFFWLVFYTFFFYLHMYSCALVVSMSHKWLFAPLMFNILYYIEYICIFQRWKKIKTTIY